MGKCAEFFSRSLASGKRLADQFIELNINCGKEHLARETLHLFEGLLYLAPVGNGLAQPLILFSGQGDTDSLCSAFAGPLIARTTRTRTAVLHIAFADPAHRR